MRRGKPRPVFVCESWFQKRVMVSVMFDELDIFRGGLDIFNGEREGFLWETIDFFLKKIQSAMNII